MSGSLLEAESLCGGYAGMDVLRHVSLQVEEGSTLAVIGANGAGKTTLLSLIAGLLRPSQGSVVWRGGECTHRKTAWRARHGLVLVPENRHLFLGMTVEENLRVAFEASERGPRSEFVSRLRWVHDLFPRLADRRSQRTWSLSGGEQQMVAIGRALVMNPECLLLDEPSVGLAPVVADEVFVAIKRVSLEGVAVLLVEQNAKAALQICEEVILLERGRAVVEGRSEVVASDQRVVAAYLGG